MAEVLELMPPDSTIQEDMVHATLFSAQVQQALDHAAQLDPWLAAHLADMMAPLSLLDEEIDAE